ncbi:MAG TPA: MFS transporter [Sphingobium sp.]|nr:MFS transporter [Sphingobium sp.]
MLRSAMRQPRAWPMLLVGGLAYLLWSAGTFAWYLAFDRVTPLPEYLFRLQDMPVLIALGVGLVALIPAADRRGAPFAPSSGRVIAMAAIIAVLAARLGRDAVFHGYSPSRDELMVELAGAYLADGHIGWPIPAEWLPYARAMMPEFYSPYGADAVWTSIYLPVHAAIRALFALLGDADFAAPAMLAVGLAALWDVARRLFPDRADARIVVMLMALTSTQLVATAMTPYAMTSHFALNMVWLALVLRGGILANLCAAAVLIAAAGLHQWHFPALFAGPVILWMLWRRQWPSALAQIAALLAAVLIWAKLWPMLLAYLLGPPVGGVARGAPGVGAKVASLFGRLDKWQPLLNIGRLIAWNNALLLPLGALSIARLPRRFAWLRDPPIILPLLMMVLIGFALALYQGYGWGFRYMHGQIGALCLLAGYGWTVLSRDGERSMRLVWGASAMSLAAMAYLLGSTEHYVRGYARTIAAMRASGADVVLVDIRGGYFMTDLVRFANGRPGRPAIMSLAMLNKRQLGQLCRTHDVALIDYRQFWALGVHPVSPVVREGAWLDSLHREMARLGCGRLVIPPSR